MPVTFKVAPHDARPFPVRGTTDLETLAKSACYKQWKESGEMLQTSATPDVLPTLTPHKNGFVHTVIEAYGKHRHLTIRYVSVSLCFSAELIGVPRLHCRPDDVWIAILTQLSF